MSETKQRELDAWIAEHVMGWDLLDRKAEGWGDGPPVWATHNEDNPTYQGFDPSTNPNAAMKVLEKCVEKISDTKQDTIKIWITTSFEWCISGGRGYYADATSLPIAICLFAQKLFSK